MVRERDAIHGRATTSHHSSPISVGMYGDAIADVVFMS